MAQLTRLSLVVALCFLGVACVDHGAAPGNSTSKSVALQCNGKGGNFTIQPKPQTVIFAAAESCPLKYLHFDTLPPGFKGPDIVDDGKNPEYRYSYTGKPWKPMSTFTFKYRVTRTPTLTKIRGAMEPGL